MNSGGTRARRRTAQFTGRQQAPKAAVDAPVELEVRRQHFTSRTREFGRGVAQCSCLIHQGWVGVVAADCSSWLRQCGCDRAQVTTHRATATLGEDAPVKREDLCSRACRMLGGS